MPEDTVSSSSTMDQQRLQQLAELRVHTGSMNRSVLTSQEPLHVMLELNKLLMVLGVQVENKGGYKLHCTRPSSATQYDPNLQPIYGHPSIDTGSELVFTLEICRFENLSGLFSIEFHCVCSNKNDSGYRFIGHKLLSLLSASNIIKNTNNFDLVLL